MVLSYMISILVVLSHSYLVHNFEVVSLDPKDGILSITYLGRYLLLGRCPLR